MSKVVEGFLSAKKLHFFRPMPIQMQEHYDRKNINQPASDLSPKKEVSSVMGEEKYPGQEDLHVSSLTSKTPIHENRRPFLVYILVRLSRYRVGLETPSLGHLRSGSFAGR